MKQEEAQRTTRLAERSGGLIIQGLFYRPFLLYNPFYVFYI